MQLLKKFLALLAAQESEVKKMRTNGSVTDLWQDLPEKTKTRGQCSKIISLLHGFDKILSFEK